MEKTPAELIEDLKSGSIKCITMGLRWRNVKLIASIDSSGIDAVMKGRRGSVTDAEAIQFVEYAKGAGMPITIE